MSYMQIENKPCSTRLIFDILIKHMATKDSKKEQRNKEPLKETRSARQSRNEEKLSPGMNPRVKSIITVIVILAIVIVIVLGGFGAAGVAGNFLYEKVLKLLFGFGVILVPILLVIYAIHLIRDQKVSWSWLEATSSIGLLFSILGFIEIISPGVRAGGILGYGVGTLATKIFDVYAGATILGALALISTLILLNEELGIPEFIKNLFAKKDSADSSFEFEEEDIIDDEEETITLTKEQLNAPVVEPLLAGEVGRRQPPGELSNTIPVGRDRGWEHTRRIFAERGWMPT